MTPGTMAVIGTGRNGCPGRCVALAMSVALGPSLGGSLCPASRPRASLKWELHAYLCSGCLGGPSAAPEHGLSLSVADGMVLSCPTRHL